MKCQPHRPSAVIFLLDFGINRQSVPQGPPAAPGELVCVI